MAQIERRWVADGAISNEKIDNADIFDIGGLNNYGNMWTAGDASVVSGLTVDGTATFNSEVNFATDSSVTGNLYVSGNIGVGVTNPASSRVMVRTYQDSGIELNDQDLNATRLVIALDASNNKWNIKATRSNAGTTYPITFMMDTTEIARMKTSGDIGIGTTNPGSMLQVSNETSGRHSEVRILKETGSSSDRASLKVGYNDSNCLEIYREQGTGRINVVSKGSGEGIYFSTTSADFLFNGGNVGIGTTNPASASNLHVSGGAANGIVHITNNVTGHTAGDGVRLLVDTASGFSIQQLENAPVAILTNALERVRITATGNVGIGITNPSYTLDVVGNARFSVIPASGATASIYLTHTSGVLATRTAGQVLTDINGQPFITAGTTSQWYRGDKTWQTISPGTIGAEPAFSSGTTLQYRRGDKSWQTLNTSVVPELTNLYFTDARARTAVISSMTTTRVPKYNGTNFVNSLIYDDGSNVGIGTTTTFLNDQFEVYAPATPTPQSVRASLHTTTAVAYFDLTNSYGTLRLQKQYGAGGTFTDSIAGAGVLGTTGSYPIQLATNNAVRLTVMDDGSGVGIGTVYATEQLVIWDTAEEATAMVHSGAHTASIYLENNYGNFLIQKQYSAGGTFTDSIAGAGVLGTTGSYPIQLATNNAVRLTVMDDGSGIGIGTTYAGEQLVIWDTAETATAMVHTGIHTASIDLENSYGNFIMQKQYAAGGTFTDSMLGSGVLGTTGAYPLHLAAYGYVYVTVKTNGFVGIGTNDPQFQCDINGTCHAYDYYSVDSPGYYNDSDGRYKENVTTISGALDKVSALRGVYFNWKENFRKERKRRIGMIAQEVESVIPEAAQILSTPEKLLDGTFIENPRALSLGGLVPLLVQAIKELKAEVDAIKLQLSA